MKDIVEITSINNETVKDAVKLQQKKYRDDSKTFLIEGFKAIQEGYNSGLVFEKIFVLKEKSEKYNFLNQMIIQTTEPVLKKISTTDSAPEAVAIAKQKLFDIEDTKNAKKITLLENIKDSGNLGTILRTAKAFNQDAIILFGDTVDLYNPKCVRSAVGNLWKIPVVQIKNFEELQKHFSTFQRLATLPKSEQSVYLNDLKIEPPYMIMFGSEADGLSEELTNFATKKVTVEMDKDVESLNLSICVGICLYKLSQL